MLLNPARWQLKAKFISIILLVLLIPVSSVALLKEIEKSLVESLKNNLLLSAKLYSLQLSNNSQWFEESRLPLTNNYVADELFVFPLQQTLMVDGFFEEWLFIEKFRKDFFAKKHTDKMGVLLGSFDNNLYLSIKALDKKVVYSEMDPIFRFDQLVINYVDNDIPQRIFILPKAPGKIPINQYINKQMKIDWRFSAYWVETEDGFNVEIKFPTSVKPTQIQVLYYDTDLKRSKNFQNIIASSHIDMSPIVWPSRRLNAFVKQVDTIPGQRVWVLDSDGRVLARKGDLDHTIASGSNSLMNWLLTYLSDSVVDTRGDRLRLNSSIIFNALQKKATSQIETPLGSDFSVALAASPILVDNQLLGIVLIEENVARVQLLQKQTLTQLLYVMLAIIFIIMAIIGWYVSKLVNRITHLKNKINSVVDEHGRMSTDVELVKQEGDEVAELNNAFVEMSNKIYDYNDYLEKLASRLSHEIRTPIAIVRSSLDNLLLNHHDKDSVEAIQRALNGTQRLGEIISRMRQASSVKNAMQSASFELVDLSEFVKQMVSGFQMSFSQYEFICKTPEVAVEKKVSPDLLAELLDKLLANAMDFSIKTQPITVELKDSELETEILVSNSGPIILNKNRHKIFQSLVSIRDSQSSGQLNLGLGLYVVKLIAEFHGAKVKSQNRVDESGVVMSVTWKK
ncbi:ATP-binding protein [Aliikangiella sp. IMCC44359]|uniref:ATP-binding protein n=1 Tax=Aliikangiella sp. IMCC44359 TaxID=3459125 RepID=UPI00403AD749